MPYGLPKKELVKLRNIILSRVEELPEACPQLKRDYQRLRRTKSRLFDYMTEENQEVFSDLITTQLAIQYNERILLVDFAIDVMLGIFLGPRAQAFYAKMEKTKPQ